MIPDVTRVFTPPGPLGDEADSSDLSPELHPGFFVPVELPTECDDDTCHPDNDTSIRCLDCHERGTFTPVPMEEVRCVSCHGSGVFEPITEIRACAWGDFNYNLPDRPEHPGELWWERFANLAQTEACEAALGN